ncbi:MAG: LysM peptidoglycan-binding domain-containing protein [Chitinophagales bacterium]
MKSILLILFIAIFSVGNIFAQDKVTHTVEAGQTLFFIAKKYDTSIDEIRALNPEIGEDLIIRPEQVIFIQSNVAASPVNENYKTHIVQAKETLYSISKQYNVSVDDLIQMNNLDEPSINIGQTLRVEALTLNEDAIFSTVAADTKVEEENKIDIEINTAPIEVDPIVLPEIEDGDSDLYKTLFDAYEGEELNKDKGIANFIEQGSDDSYLVLANDVPINQVLKVRNLMNNKIVYLKVVGELPENDVKNNVSIKVSKAAAKKLNVIEARFLAEWSWYNVELSSPSLDEKVEETKTEFEFVPYDDF